MVRLRWMPQALDDLDAIAAYISEDSSRRADSFIKEIIKTSDLLRSFPLSGRVIPELHDPSLRELIHGKYRIMYEYYEDEAMIEIHTVIHGARIFDRSLFFD